ncbi:hypothetical protein V22_30200 [Calycomorphotria hydatis]|uniref:Uncharacterized protein n=1 Tax=Calycomorphotria hydatis TaxID=2528027 RepID=A0A517TBL6_9PLAN|nr:hypothetical protein V22_30200 [Calycomorphotria hydatis]
MGRGRFFIRVSSRRTIKSIKIGSVVPGNTTSSNLSICPALCWHCNAAKRPFALFHTGCPVQQCNVESLLARSASHKPAFCEQGQSHRIPSQRCELPILWKCPPPQPLSLSFAIQTATLETLRSLENRSREWQRPGGLVLWLPTAFNSVGSPPGSCFASLLNATQPRS